LIHLRVYIEKHLHDNIISERREDWVSPFFILRGGICFSFYFLSVVVVVVIEW